LDEEIDDDKSTRKTDYGQICEPKNPPMDALRAPREKEGKTGWQSPENMGQDELGF
jgi:hypothetical protein